MFLVNLWMQAASCISLVCPRQHVLNEREAEQEALQKHSSVLIMWKTGVDSLLPQTLCRPCALLQILKVSPSAKAVRCIHILRVRVRNCIMKEQLGVIEQSFVGFHHTPSTGNTDVSKLKGYDILETAWIAQHSEFCTVYIIFDSS